MRKTQTYQEAQAHAAAWVATHKGQLPDPRCGHASEIFVRVYQANEGFCSLAGAHLVFVLAYGCKSHEDGYPIPETTFERFCPFQKGSRPYLACEWSRARTYAKLNRDEMRRGRPGVAF